MTNITNILICGGGNAAHVLAATLSSRYRVSVYAPYGNEAELLRAGVKEQGGITARSATQTWFGKPWRISADPAEVFPDTEMVLLALPSSAHAATLEAGAPYLSPGAWIVALPARGGFNWEARDLLGSGYPLAGLQTLPWACRIVPGHYGKVVEILGTKRVVDLASHPADKAPETAKMLSEHLQVSLAPAGSLLALTLANTGQLIHPGIMYGLFHDWDGEPFGEEDAPLFYGGVTQDIAAQLETMSAEVQAVTASLAQHFPDHDWSAVLPLVEWVRRSYIHDIADPSDLRTCFTTNRAYDGLRAPVSQVGEDEFVPFFEGRYLVEDIPFGLLVTRGIAEILTIPTPAIDAVILWAQKALGREWMVEGKVQGSDVAASRAPQRYGLTEPQQLLL